MATTRKVLRQDIIQKLYSPSYPTATEATAGGSTTTIKDAILAPGGRVEDYVAAWIYIVEKQGSGPEIGEVSRVTDVDFSSTNSTLALGAALTAVTESGMEYEIHYKFHPGVVNDVINDVIRFAARGTLAALTADTGTTTLEQDVLVAGALAALTRSLAAHEPSNIGRIAQAQQYEEEYLEGLVRLGYPRQPRKEVAWQQQDRR